MGKGRDQPIGAGRVAAFTDLPNAAFRNVFFGKQQWHAGTAKTVSSRFDSKASIGNPHDRHAVVCRAPWPVDLVFRSAARRFDCDEDRLSKSNTFMLSRAIKKTYREVQIGLGKIQRLDRKSTRLNSSH